MPRVSRNRRRRGPAAPPPPARGVDRISRSRLIRPVGIPNQHVNRAPARPPRANATACNRSGRPHYGGRGAVSVRDLSTNVGPGALAVRRRTGAPSRDRRRTAAHGRIGQASLVVAVHPPRRRTAAGDTATAHSPPPPARDPGVLPRHRFHPHLGQGRKTGQQPPQ